MAAIFPELRSPLPGPKATALMAQDHQFTSPSYTRGYPLVIDHGYGAMVVDVDGNRFLDFCAGIAVNATGHSHPAVVQAIQQQATKFLHMSGTDFYYQALAELAETLAVTSQLTEPAKVVFSNSGTEAIEASLKLARYATGRTAFIAFTGSFHGRTLGALSLNASKVVQRQGFGPMLQPVFHAPYPNPYRQPEAAQATLTAVNDLFKTVISPKDVAAFVIEPIQGEGGYIIPPDGFLLRLRQLADQHGILIIADEVQSGNGRTGKLWAFEHEAGFEPDIIATAKGLASGLPLGAVIAKSLLMTWPPGAHASTFGGNPLACVAALATYQLLQNGLMQNAERLGHYLRNALHALKAAFPQVVGDVRCRGLMAGIELVEHPDSKLPNALLRDAVVNAAFYEGLLVLGCGTSTIRLCPPLVICDAQIDKALDILTTVLKKLT
jgi:4-aminobutyrate aminotransferase